MTTTFRTIESSTLSHPHPLRRPPRGGDRVFLLSLALSVLIHAVIGMALGLYFRTRTTHVFLLVESGEEALELEIGGAFDSAGSEARPPAEVAEKRFVPLAPVPFREEEKDPVVLEAEPAFLVEEQALSSAESPPNSSLPQRRPPAAERTVETPEPLPPPPGAELAESPDGLAGLWERDVKEVRYAESVDPENREAERPLVRGDEKINAVADPANVSAAAELAENPPERLTRRTPRSYHDDDAKPEQMQPAALTPSAPTAASKAGAELRSRGVRQRVRPNGALVPHYPDGARRRGETGTVVVRALIDAAGRCVWARVESSSGYAAFDNAAVDTVRRGSFQPALVDGTATAMEDRFMIEFRLR